MLVAFSLAFAHLTRAKEESRQRLVVAESRAGAKVEYSVKDKPELSALFRSDKIWDGGDGAMSNQLSRGKILWLFGDSFIKKPGTKDRTMINNSVAIQSVEKGHEDWHFYWRGDAKSPHSIFVPNEREQYYWPGCGTIYNGKLYLLLKKISVSNESLPPFNFAWKETDLVVVENPQDKPTEWVYRQKILPTYDDKLDWAIATYADSKYLYVFCLGAKQAESIGKPVKLARILLKDLEHGDTTGWEFSSARAGGESSTFGWSRDYKNAKTIISVGGPEMSLFFSSAHNCFISVFQEPMSDFVVLSVAQNIDGKWSKPERIFKVPEAQIVLNGRKVLTYAAKAHPLLSDGDEIVFTYCVNPGGETDHLKRPDLYFPVAKTLILKRDKVATLLELVK